MDISEEVKHTQKKSKHIDPLPRTKNVGQWIWKIWVA